MSSLQTHGATTTRRIIFDACYNVRDLGGLPRRNGTLTRHGAFVRADLLTRLTPDGIEAVRRYPVSTVVDLRRPDEIEANPNPFAGRSDLGIQHANLSMMDVTNEQVMAVDRARPPMLTWNIEMLRLAAPEIAATMTLLAQPRQGAALFHCHAGKDRTGLVAMMLEDLADVDEAAIVDDYIQSNNFLQPVYDQILARYAVGSPERTHLEANMPCKPVTASGTLEHLRNAHGGVAPYLRHIGVSDADIAALRARLS